MNANIDEFIAGLPKAELHLHLEGSLEPEQMFEFARRNDIDIPYTSIAEVKAAYQFSKLQDFLDIYYMGMNVLQTEQDFFDLTAAYLRKVAAENTRHVEVFFDPQGHTERGISFKTAITGIHNALTQVGGELGVSFKLIMCFLRHLDEASAIKTLNQAKPFKHLLTGVGLDSSELGNPPEKFEIVFKMAKDQGYKLVAHAGEEGPVEYVYDTLDLLNVDRIDHGNRCMDDAILVARIAKQKIALTVCPLSNLKLQVVTDMTKHPIKAMLESGIIATINSDDPAYFGGYMNDNYRSVAHPLNLSIAELTLLAKNSFIGSFLPQAAIDKHVAAIDDYAASFKF
ncbi:MAG: adenosine deaminase [Rhizobiales bacterium]|nr:adenosine deaminase [Hyphomicrobiales bacterium]NRB14546.1 adenosine deaminase [Hyphomicrobiales bacterium]